MCESHRTTCASSSAAVRLPLDDLSCEISDLPAPDDSRSKSSEEVRKQAQHPDAAPPAQMET